MKLFACLIWNESSVQWLQRWYLLMSSKSTWQLFKIYYMVCVYMPEITKFCNYPFDIGDKRNDRLWYIWPWKTRTEHLKTEITNLILACYIYFMTHKSRPNTIIHYLIMLITVVSSSKLNFLKKKRKKGNSCKRL